MLQVAGCRGPVIRAERGSIILELPFGPRPLHVVTSTRVNKLLPMTVLICGSPASGFQIIGLFANSADAQSYAEDYSLKDW